MSCDLLTIKALNCATITGNFEFYFIGDFSFVTPGQAGWPKSELWEIVMAWLFAGRMLLLSANRQHQITMY